MLEMHCCRCRCHLVLLAQDMVCVAVPGEARETRSLEAPGSDSQQSQSQLTPFASEGAAAWEDEGQGGSMEVIGRLWPMMTAIFLAGTFVILIFPFFTYIESSGLIGESLPKVSALSASPSFNISWRLPRPPICCSYRRFQIGGHSLSLPVQIGI